MESSFLLLFGGVPGVVRMYVCKLGTPLYKADGDVKTAVDGVTTPAATLLVQLRYFSLAPTGPPILFFVPAHAPRHAALLRTNTHPALRPLFYAHTQSCGSSLRAHTQRCGSS